MKKTISLLIFFFFAATGFSQPFVDIVNGNSQIYNSVYQHSNGERALAVDYNLNVFIPKAIGERTTLLFRLCAEDLEIGRKVPYYDLISIAAPVGFQVVSKNKKWKYCALDIPRISCEKDGKFRGCTQMGATGLVTYVFNDSLKVKVGLFYNRECFGNFFVPLLGIDWKATKHWSIYGILPNNMRVEYKCNKNVYVGLGFKNYKRSYWLLRGYHTDYFLVKETQLKLFVDFYTKAKVILFADLGYMLQYSFTEHLDDRFYLDARSVAAPMKNNFLFTVGLAYRIRE